MTLDINYKTTNPLDRDKLIIDELNSLPIPDITSGNFNINPTLNTIGASIAGSNVTAMGGVSAPNDIGVTNRTPSSASAIHSWAVDSSYPAGAASVATIFSGYDNVNNQLAGVIGGFHCYIQYNADGHSSALSGSYNWIQAGRACVIAGTQNKISTNGQFGLIGEGRFNVVDNQFGTIANGQNNQSTGVGSTVLYGEASSATAEGAVIVSGKNSVNAALFGTMRGDSQAADSGSSYVDLGGIGNNSLSGYTGFIRGSNNGLQNPGGAIFADNSFIFGRGLVIGREAHQNQPGAVYISNNKLARVGDNGSFITHGALRTTNATATNMNLSIAPTSMLAVPDNTTWAVTARVIATNEDTMAVNTWDVRADVKRVNGVLAFVSAATITARAAEMALTLSMTVSASTGLLRFNCTGIAATNIMWCATFEVTETRGAWSDTFTANATTDELTLVTTAKALQPGEKVRVSNSGGALPAGLSAGVDYWVYLPTGPYYGQNFFKLATTPSGVAPDVVTTTPNGISIKRTGIRSTVIDLTDVGTGTHTITRV